MKRVFAVCISILMILIYAGCPTGPVNEEDDKSAPAWSAQPSVNTETTGSFTLTAGTVTGEPAPSTAYYYAPSGTALPGGNESTHFDSSSDWSSVTPDQAVSADGGAYILYGTAENSEGTVLSSKIDFTVTAGVVFSVSYHANGGTGAVTGETVGTGETVTLGNGTGFAGALIRDGIRQRVIGWSDVQDGTTVTHQFDDQVPVNSNLTFYAVYSSVAEDGDVTGMVGPAGGLIAYDAGQQESWGRYIEAAPYDVLLNNSGTMRWGGDGTDVTALPNNNGTPPLNSSILTSEIGLGAHYTDLILAELGTTAEAASLCNDYTYGGKNDWFLPSIGEVDLLYKNLFSNSLGNFDFPLGTLDFTFLGYLSSTELDENGAWQLMFIFEGSNSGEAHGVSKADWYSVRPCRYVDSTVPPNNPPAANSGSDQNVTLGTSVNLDGSGSSDSDSDPLSYSWSIQSAPTGSAAALTDSTIVNPSFTPDLVGDYMIQLIVNDGTENSSPDTVTITATSPISFTVEKLDNIDGTRNLKLDIHPANNSLLTYGFTNNSGEVMESSNYGNSWTTSGSINSVHGLLRFSNSNNSFVYSLDSGGNLQVSNNGGSSWNSRTLPGSDWIYDIAVHPADPATVYTSRGTLFLKSENYGADWTDLTQTANATGFPSSTNYKSIFIDPDTPQTVFVLTETGGLFKTTDGGSNWNYAGPGYATGNVLYFLPTANGETIYLIEGDRIYKSLNSGTDWTYVYTHSGHDINDSYGGMGALGIKQDDPNTVFMISNDTNALNLYRSTDGAETFSAVYTFENHGLLYNSPYFSFITDPVDTNTIYLTKSVNYGHDSEILRSQDAGLTWEPLENGLDSFDLHHLEIRDNDLFLFEGNLTVFDMAANRKERLYSINRWANGTAWDPNNPAVLWHANAQGLGKITVNTNSISDAQVHSPGDGGYALGVTDNNGTTEVYYSSFNSTGDTIVYKTNTGAFFNELNTPANTSRIVDIEIDPADPDKIILGTYGNGYFVTLNGGTDWIHYANPGTIVDIVIDQTDSSIIYFLTPDTVYKSTDGGLSAAMTTSQNQTYMDDILPNLIIDPINANTLYTCAAGGQDASWEINYTVDGGASWLKYNPLPSLAVNSGYMMFRFDPADSNTLYMTAQYLGVYKITITRH